MSASTRTIPLALAIAITASACSKQASYTGMFLGAVAIPTGYLLVSHASRDEHLIPPQVVSGLVLIAGGSLLLIGSAISLAIAYTSDPTKPGPPVEELEPLSIEEYRLCIAHRQALERAALAKTDPNLRADRLANLPVCDAAP